MLISGIWSILVSALFPIAIDAFEDFYRSPTFMISMGAFQDRGRTSVNQDQDQDRTIFTFSDQTTS